MTTTDNLQAIGATALSTAAALAPALAVLDPKAAAIADVARIALTFLQSASQLQQAGVIPAVQLANLFASVGSGILSAHAQWGAMNAADAAAAPAAPKPAPVAATA